MTSEDPNSQENFHLGNCPSCHSPVYQNDIRNSISMKEWKISGLCQECQDEVFGED